MFETRSNYLLSQDLDPLKVQTAKTLKIKKYTYSVYLSDIAHLERNHFIYIGIMS